MELSRKADYALRAMVELASSCKSHISAKELAQLTQVPYAFMAKIVAELASHGFVENQRGYGGGVKINADPARVSVLQIIEAMDGPLKLNRCVIELKSCPRTSSCAVHEVLSVAQKQLV